MSLDKLPANKLLTMTQNRALLFRAAGCEPECHHCNVAINEGVKFKLATWEDDDVMLCSKCTITELCEAKKERSAEIKAYRKQYYRQFRKHPGYTRRRDIK